MAIMCDTMINYLLSSTFDPLHQTMIIPSITTLAFIRQAVSKYINPTLANTKYWSMITRSSPKGICGMIVNRKSWNAKAM